MWIGEEEKADKGKRDGREGKIRQKKMEGAVRTGRQESGRWGWLGRGREKGTDNGHYTY